VHNQERATRAMQVAEAGVSHAVSLLRGSLKSYNFTRILRGSNALVPSGDEGRLIGTIAPPTGYGLQASDEIPIAGKAFQGGTYFVQVLNDPDEASTTTDLNGRVLVRCRAVTSDGATASIDAIVGSVPMPGIAADGNLAFAGANVTIGGECGGAHSNGNLSATGGGPTISAQATATGTVSGNWNGAPELESQPQVVIPDLNPMDFCAEAEFRLLSNGNVQTVATGTQVPAAGTGWTYTAGSTTWAVAGAVAPGTYCATGNVTISGGGGTAAAPLRISVLATGSIGVSGNTFLAPDHSDNILLMAGGDIRVAGNPGSAYGGLVYAAAQCLAEGNASLSGQILCANGAHPAGATPYATAHTVQGSFTLNFDCSANVFNKRRVLYWYPRIGT
jgi:hypothetical protein